MPPDASLIDVLCVGRAAFDLVFLLAHHPAPDEKCFASALVSCGGGPAANAAVTVARLGYKSAFFGYLGRDFYGEEHLQELKSEGVNVDFVVRGAFPTPLSVILVKPNGERTVVHYRGDTPPLTPGLIDPQAGLAKAMLFDGHEVEVSLALLEEAKKNRAITILDAGSVHAGTQSLIGLVDYVVASEKFARDFTGKPTPEEWLDGLGRVARRIVVTLGAAGLVWRNESAEGTLPAFAVKAVDSTAAGDVFHGAFACGLVSSMPWLENLKYASAAAAICCTRKGGRLGIPAAGEVRAFLARRNRDSPGGIP